jgi:hypothetical protein
MLRSPTVRILTMCIAMIGCVNHTPPVPQNVDPTTLATAKALWAIENGVNITPAEQALVDAHEAKNPSYREKRLAAERNAREVDALFRRANGYPLTPDQKRLVDEYDRSHPNSDGLTAQQRAERDFETAKATRERELLERALSNSPDYTSALQRAAVANVEGPPPRPGVKRSTLNPRAKEAAVAAEVARLSDEIEQQRRQAIAAREVREQLSRDARAHHECDLRGRQMEAAYYNPRSFLNLEAVLAGNMARADCMRANGL